MTSTDTVNSEGGERSTSTDTVNSRTENSEAELTEIESDEVQELYKSMDVPIQDLPNTMNRPIQVGCTKEPSQNDEVDDNDENKKNHSDGDDDRKQSDTTGSSEDHVGQKNRNEDDDGDDEEDNVDDKQEDTNGSSDGIGEEKEDDDDEDDDIEFCANHPLCTFNDGKLLKENTHKCDMCKRRVHGAVNCCSPEYNGDDIPFRCYDCIKKKDENDNVNTDLNNEKNRHEENEDNENKQDGNNNADEEQQKKKKNKLSRKEIEEKRNSTGAQKPAGFFFVPGSVLKNYNIAKTPAPRGMVGTCLMDATKTLSSFWSKFHDGAKELNGMKREEWYQRCFGPKWKSTVRTKHGRKDPTIHIVNEALASFQLKLVRCRKYFTDNITHTLALCTGTIVILLDYKWETEEKEVKSDTHAIAFVATKLRDGSVHRFLIDNLRNRQAAVVEKTDYMYEKNGKMKLNDHKHSMKCIYRFLDMDDEVVEIKVNFAYLLVDANLRLPPLKQHLQENGMKKSISDAVLLPNSTTSSAPSKMQKRRQRKRKRDALRK